MDSGEPRVSGWRHDIGFARDGHQGWPQLTLAAEVGARVGHGSECWSLFPQGGAGERDGNEEEEEGGCAEAGPTLSRPCSLGDQHIVQSVQIPNSVRRVAAATTSHLTTYWQRPPTHLTWAGAGSAVLMAFLMAVHRTVLDPLRHISDQRSV